MADNLKNDGTAGAAAGEGHNGAPLSKEEKADLIRKLDEDLQPLEAQQQATNRAITKLHRDFKTKTRITKANFVAARKLALIEDEDEQKAKADDLELCFNALSQNAQLTFDGLDGGNDE